MTYVLAFCTLTLRVLSVTERDSPYRDLAEIVQKPFSHRVIFTTSTQKSHGHVLAGSLRLSEEPTIIFGAKMTI